MGLLSKLRGKKPPPTQGDVDAALLFAAPYAVSKASGEMGDEEFFALQLLVRAVPELKALGVERLVEMVTKLDPTLGDLAKLSTPALKRKAFLLAAEVAMVSGDIDDDEDEALGGIADVLEIDAETAKKIIEVLAWKYVG